MTSSLNDILKQRLQALREKHDAAPEPAVPFSFHGDLLDKLQLSAVGNQQSHLQVTVHADDLKAVQEEHKAAQAARLEEQKMKLNALQSGQSPAVSVARNQPHHSGLYHLVNSEGQVKPHALNLLLLEEVKNLRARLTVLEEQKTQ